MPGPLNFKVKAGLLCPAFEEVSGSIKRGRRVEPDPI